jgi:hypothetical protein
MTAGIHIQNDKCSKTMLACIHFICALGKSGYTSNLTYISGLGHAYASCGIGFFLVKINDNIFWWRQDRRNNYFLWLYKDAISLAMVITAEVTQTRQLGLGSVLLYQLLHPRETDTAPLLYYTIKTVFGILRSRIYTFALVITFMVIVGGRLVVVSCRRLSSFRHTPLWY